MELSGDSTRSEPVASNAAWWHSDIAENLKSVSLAPRGETLTTGGFPCDVWQAEYSSQAASQILWSTGTYSGLIPNGFYSIIPVRNRIFYHRFYFYLLNLYCFLSLLLFL